MLLTINNSIAQKSKYSLFNILISFNGITTELSDKTLNDCYRILNIPLHSKQDVVHRAFIDLAKRYHPDSGSPEANIDKFCTIENAFRVLTKHNTNNSSIEDVDKIVFDIRHTAPQHRQYLSFDGIGTGTPSQRMKQWTQARAQKAAINVMDHRIAKAVASENTLMKKDDGILQKHDIKTKYGFDRLVEDLIQESISKGEFENLTGSGKPLRHQNRNPYVDFTTHKLNEVLINNGFTPEWITMNKDIDEDIDAFKKVIKLERSKLGKFPLCCEEQQKWLKICNANRDIARSINTKINTFNIIVPLLNKQKFHIQFEKICEEILQKGEYTRDVSENIRENEGAFKIVKGSNTNEDIMVLFFKVVSDLFADLTKSFISSNNNKKGGEKI